MNVSVSSSGEWPESRSSIAACFEVQAKFWVKDGEWRGKCRNVLYQAMGSAIAIRIEVSLSSEWTTRERLLLDVLVFFPRATQPRCRRRRHRPRPQSQIYETTSSRRCPPSQEPASTTYTSSSRHLVNQMDYSHSPARPNRRGYICRTF